MLEVDLYLTSELYNVDFFLGCKITSHVFVSELQNIHVSIVRHICFVWLCAAWLS